MAAHKYWRLFYTTNQGNSYCGASEIYMRTVSGGAVATVGGNVLSSGQTSTWSPTYAFDGLVNSNMWYGTGATNQWIGYQFPNPVDIVEFALIGAGNASIATGHFDYSDDGVNWYVALNLPTQAGWNTTSTYTFKLYKGVLTGDVIEDSPITDWRALAIRISDGTVQGQSAVSGLTYTINTFTREPCMVVMTPKIDYAWSAGKASKVGEYVVSATPDTTPHIWKCSNVVGDANYINKTLVLHFNGAQGSTSFPDTSSSPKTTSIYSGTPIITTSQSMFGNGSLDVSGTSGAKDIAVANTPAFVTGTGDFTIQGWFTPTSSGSGRIAVHKGVNAAGGWCVGCSTTEVYFRRNGTTDMTIAAVLSSTVPSHIAWVNYNGVQYIYLNGQMIGASALAINITDTSDIHIGSTAAWFSDSNRFYGYIDELSISNVAEYTGNFTPPTVEGIDVAGGVTGTTEPPWNLTGTTADNFITWSYVGPLVTPVAIGPRIPAIYV